MRKPTALTATDTDLRKRSRSVLCLELEAAKQKLMEARGMRLGVLTAQQEMMEVEYRLALFDKGE